jgi:hypothetical protein
VKEDLFLGEKFRARLKVVADFGELFGIQLGTLGEHTRLSPFGLEDPVDLAT